MNQLGNILSELADCRFENIGSLFNDGDGSYFVGECVSPSFTWQTRDSLDLDRDPFEKEDDYLMSLISGFTLHVQELPRKPHTFIAPVPNMSDYSISLEIGAYASEYGGMCRRFKRLLHLGDMGLIREQVPSRINGPGNNCINL